MPAATRNVVTETFFKYHPELYRRSGGRIGGHIGNAPVILLNSRGRKSGLPRTNGLMCVAREDSWLVAASWAGEPKHPTWYLNLMAQPETTIEFEGKVVPVQARELEGQEREKAWSEIVAQDQGFAVYEERTRGIREIPVILLERRPARLLYGLSCSYFTGKLEAYFYSKGIPFEFVEMHRTQFRECAKATGIAQLPCVREPDGSWLTDTTKIMEHFESAGEGPEITPTDAATAFCSALMEDLFDEWYWRPALYYRWAHADDARLMSTELGREILRDLPLPLFMRRWFILFRQRMVYLKQDGVTKKTAPAIEKLYLNSLAELDQIFSKRPWLFGDHPCEADYGLFGPFFRHFFCDPTSGALMRKRAPHLLNWVTRLWKTRPADLKNTVPASAIPDDLGYFFEMISDDYLPYLAANAEAVARGDKQVSYRAQNVEWQIPSAPYRVQCLNDLKQKFVQLPNDAQAAVAQHLSAAALELLRAPATETKRPKGRLGRLWQPA